MGGWDRVGCRWDYGLPMGILQGLYRPAAILSSAVLLFAVWLLDMAPHMYVLVYDGASCWVGI